MSGHNYSLSVGSKLPSVGELQRALLRLDPGLLPKFGADQWLGKETMQAVAAVLNQPAIAEATILTPVQVSQVHELAEAKAFDVIKVEGNRDNLKAKARDFSKAAFIQVHQTDFWPGDKLATIKNIKTNLYVSTRAVYEVHQVDEIVVDNYSDFTHIEVAWVSESRKTVVEKGVTYHREAGEWTPEREALLETALVYQVGELRARGQDPTIITHNQSYTRTIDPDLEIAQATHRICKKHGFKLDFGWHRGSGKSADFWYPEGEGKLG